MNCIKSECPWKINGTATWAMAEERVYLSTQIQFAQLYCDLWAK